MRQTPFCPSLERDGGQKQVVSPHPFLSKWKPAALAVLDGAIELFTWIGLKSNRDFKAHPGEVRLSELWSERGYDARPPFPLI